MTPERREIHRGRLTAEREQVRVILAELAALRHDAPEQSELVFEEASHAARRLFTELGACRDELGRLAR